MSNACPSPYMNQSRKSLPVSDSSRPGPGCPDGDRFKFGNSWIFDIAYFAILDLDLGSIEGSQRDNK